MSPCSSPCQAVPTHHTELGIWALASHGHRIVTGSVDGTAQVWDVDRREVLGILWGHVRSVYRVGTNGRYIVTVSDNVVYVRDANSLSLSHTLEDKHSDWVRSVTMLGDSHVLTRSTDKTIVFTDLATGATVDRVVMDFVVCHVAISSDGGIAA